MAGLAEIYRRSWGLLTDLYQLTMAYGYWKQGMAEREAVFQLTFRKAPFEGQLAVACGLSHAIDLLEDWRFTEEDARYLAELRGGDGKPLFEPRFLSYLRGLQFTCDVDAIPEGTVVFAHEPLVSVTGPLLQAQIIETALLNIVNFQTLIATKAARICQATQGEPVIEFGLRRAQGVDGGVAASRAAYIGGCFGTSNVLAGKLFDIPVRGTHAHSWIMAFDSELEAFRAYADALPSICIFLVDTYETLQGVRHAATVGAELRERGHQMVGVRLDSGDLIELSKQTREILDEAGFPGAAVVASNDLDEHEISRLKQAGAKINLWGVGTKLATAYDQPALGGVYKLSAIHDGQRWRHKIKLSEEPLKISTPGKLQVRRFRDGSYFAGDVLYDELSGWAKPVDVVWPDGTAAWSVADAHEELLVPIFRRGELVYQRPSIHELQARSKTQLQQLGERVTRLVEPEPYRVGLERGLYNLKQRLVAEAESEHRRTGSACTMKHGRE